MSCLLNLNITNNGLHGSINCLVFAKNELFIHDWVAVTSVIAYNYPGHVNNTKVKVSGRYGLNSINLKRNYCSIHSVFSRYPLFYVERYCKHFTLFEVHVSFEKLILLNLSNHSKKLKLMQNILLVILLFLCNSMAYCGM